MNFGPVRGKNFHGRGILSHTLVLCRGKNFVVRLSTTKTMKIPTIWYIVHVLQSVQLHVHCTQCMCIIILMQVVMIYDTVMKERIASISFEEEGLVEHNL